MKSRLYIYFAVIAVILLGAVPVARANLWDDGQISARIPGSGLFMKTQASLRTQIMHARTVASISSAAGQTWNNVIDTLSNLWPTETPSVPTSLPQSVPSVKTAKTATQSAQQTAIQQIVERKTVIVPADVASLKEGIVEELLKRETAVVLPIDLSALQLREDLARINASLSQQTEKLRAQLADAEHSIALTNKINSLYGITISSPTFTGGTVSGLTDADIPNDITASNYLPLTGGILTGTFTLSGLGTDMLTSLNASGQLVATSTPTAAAYLATSTTATSTFSGGFTAGNNAALTVNQGATANSLYITKNGNVGIGTVSPTRILTVASSTAAQLMLSDGSLTSNPWNFRSINNNLYIATSSPSTFATSTVPAFVINNNGYVGIGTTTPNNRIQVAGLINFNNTDKNTLVGSSAGNSLPSGAQLNTALGYQALFTANGTGADENTAVGYQSLYSNTSGDSNTAIGLQSLYTNTTGSNNAALGSYALYENTTGQYNTALGVDALFSNITGSGNSAIGFNALLNNLSATSTVAIGYKAAEGPTDYYNQGGTYVGYFAGLKAGINSDYNTFIGYQAGYDITRGNDNILIGANVDTGGNHLTTGMNNICISYNCILPGGTTATNQLNIGNLIFGTSLTATSSSTSIPSTLTGSIGIGTTSPTEQFSVANRLYVGGTGTSTIENNLWVRGALRTGINSAYLDTNGLASLSGNLSVQSLPANNLLLNQNGGNVGIGTTTPNWNLQVAGTRPSIALSDTGAGGTDLKHWLFSSMGGNLYVGTSTDSYATTTDYQAFTILNNGYVGIGTTTPNNRIQVVDLISFKDADFTTLLGYQAGKNLPATTYYNTVIGYQALYTANNAATRANVAIGFKSMYDNTSGSDNAAIGYNSMNDNTTGVRNVGLGSEALELNKGGSDNTALGTYSLLYNTWATSSVAVGSQAAYGNDVEYHNQGGTYVGYKSGFMVGNNSDYNIIVGYQSGYNITTGSNNIWIGTATSSTAIANLTIGSQNILIGNNISLPSATASGQLNIGNIIFGTDIMGTGSTISSGNIGIGTTTPNWKMQIAGTRPSLAISDTGAGGTDLKHWLFSSMGGNLYVGTSTDSYATTTGYQAFTILNNGNVGIGTSTPTSALSIEGTCIDTGPGCADFAELYPSSEPVEAGDIVAVDPENSKMIKKAYSTSSGQADAQDVAIGIVSSNPAIAIEGSALQFMSGAHYQVNPTKPAVALSGRVPVKVSDENGSIKIGDRIAPSSIPGVGRKANAGEQTVGIALESYSDRGEGKIVVFVNLGQPTLTAQEGVVDLGNIPHGGQYDLFTNLNLNNFELRNVQAIQSYSGNWSIDANGKLMVKEIETEKLKTGDAQIQRAQFGSSDQPTGITIYDEITKEALCIKSVNRSLASTLGACGSNDDAATESQPEPSTSTNADTSTAPPATTDSANEVISPTPVSEPQPEVEIVQ